MIRATIFSFLVLGTLFVFSTPVFAQGETTSAIVGGVADTSDAVVPGAKVTVTNRETGLQRMATTDEQGRFSFPQLQPGKYSVKVEAEGFDQQQVDNVAAGLGQKQSVNFVLRVAQSKITVEVSGQAPLVNPGNANTSTTLSAPALENLPNPGGDLTYPLQFAPGALMNTAGSGNDFVGSSNGYGNVEFNGLPALSNGYNPATITNRFRPPASIGISIRRIRRGFDFKPTRDCRPLGPIRSIHCSTRFLLSLSTRLRQATLTSFRKTW
jgi:hypothetical protein